MSQEKKLMYYLRKGVIITFKIKNKNIQRKCTFLKKIVNNIIFFYEIKEDYILVYELVRMGYVPM